MKNLLSLLALPILLAASCNKDEPENLYSNYVSCKVNGKEWKSNCADNIVFGCPATDCLFSWSYPKSIYLYAPDYKNKSEMYFDFKNIDSLNKSSSYIYGIDTIKYYLDTTKTNYFSLSDTTDKTKFNIRGNFELNLISSSKKTIKLTNGYFQTAFR
jgi:hypothetical protein